mmetsp:Transcript_18580/g.52211  ORF Transcript_18580/g.52211 Transcript_18580/m.52211 type:complete len:154 (-) Transcript_18580:381-842(-)
MDPVKGGGTGPGFTWEQTLTDVTVSIELPAATQKRDLQLELRPTYIRAAVAQHEAQQPLVLIEGSLFGRVRTFESGSSWELVREKGKLVLVITLEKACKSVAPKFDYWRSVIPGQEEIDTHKLSREAEGLSLNMINPGDLDAMQMRNMGVQGF